jgi:hypothetical protein
MMEYKATIPNKKHYAKVNWKREGRLSSPLPKWQHFGLIHGHSTQNNPNIVCPTWALYHIFFVNICFLLISIV